MPTTYKNARLQGTSAVTTYATLYTTPTGTNSVVASILVCNTAGSQATFRLAIMDSAGTPAAADWMSYDTVVPANDTTTLQLSLCLAAGQVIRASSSASTVTFQAHLSEVS